MMKKTVFGLAVAVTVIAAGCAMKGGAGSAEATGLAAARDFQTGVKDGAVTVTGYTGSVEDVTIPGRVGGLPVAAIGDRAFWGNRLTSVTIPDGVAVIGDSAFVNNRLTSVTIPDGVTVIGEEAFEKNRLTSVTIPDGVTVIGNYAFARNRLTGVTIGNAVAAIGNGAFYGNQLTNVVIPDSVTAIGHDAFRGNQLTSVAIPVGVTAIGGGAFQHNQLTRVAIPANVDISVSSFNSLVYALYTEGGRKAAVYGFSYGNDGDFAILASPQAVEITGYKGTAKVLAIPAEINGLPVAAIGGAVFRAKQLTGVTIPDGVTAIGPDAFARNQLTSVAIPDGVTAIGDGAFKSNQLTSVTIPGSVKTIEYDAFTNNELTSVTLPAGVNVSGPSQPSFPGDLDAVYTTANSKAAGTYTRPSTNSTTWTKQAIGNR